MGGRFLLSILLTLLPAFAPCEDVVVHRVSGFSTEKAPRPMSRDIMTIWTSESEEPPVLAHFAGSLKDTVLQHGAWRSIYDQPFIFAVYEDGTVYYSEDTLIGGPPYYRRALNIQELEAVHAVIDLIEQTPNNRERYWHNVNDFRQIVHNIVTAKDGKVHELRSTHLYFEAFGELLATNEGYIEADGRCFADISSTQPLHFVEYRQAWQDSLELHSLFEDASATLAGEVESDFVWLSPAGEYQFPEDFEDNRITRLLMELEGDTVKIDELRSWYQYVPPLNPAGSCD